MSVLIKDMEMPKNCYECSLTNDGFYLCKACPPPFATLETDCEKSRPGWCPLIEIHTPHGRLIDADALANKTFYNPVSAPYITYRAFIDAPTIIEAEGE